MLLLKPDGLHDTSPANLVSRNKEKNSNAGVNITPLSEREIGQIRGKSENGPLFSRKEIKPTGEITDL